MWHVHLPDTLIKKEKNQENVIARHGVMLQILPLTQRFFMQQYKEVLNKYIPDGSVNLVFEWIRDYKVHLRISRQRNTKLGDFRPAFNGQSHRISVNHNLNKYAFLITFVHEFAHLYVDEKYGRKVRPHGKEWKLSFKELMNPVFELSCFPVDIEIALKSYLENAAASSSSNLNLARVLKKYDPVKEEEIIIEELPQNSIFKINSGKTFKKLEKRRKRYKCLNLTNNKLYLFDPLTPVILINDN